MNYYGDTPTYSYTVGEGASLLGMFSGIFILNICPLPITMSIVPENSIYN